MSKGRAIITRLDPIRARKLYDIGFSDRKIAATLGVANGTVGYWRKMCGLPPNINKGEREKSNLSQDAMNAKEHGMSYGQWMAFNHNS